MGEVLTLVGERFVGRDHELSHLDAACRNARAGRGQLVVVTGAAGIGKTRLCDELAERAEDAGLRVVSARCWVEGGAPALWPWQPLLTELCGPDAADLLLADSGAPDVDPDRFARFVAVSDRIAEACAASPTCLVIDDLHAADVGTLLLVRFLARSLRRLPLLLVLTARTGEPAAGSPEARLLDEIRTESTPFVLRQFDLDETLAFLECHGLGELGLDLALALYMVTGGHPLFLRRIAALGPPDAAQTLPSGLQVAIEQGLARLTPATLEVLQLAAVLGSSPSVAETAALAAVDPRAVLDALDEALAAGLVTTDTPHHFTFTHDLVRSTLEGGLRSAARLEAHAMAAAVVSIDGPASPDGLARRARHALAAAARSAADAQVAVAACRDAARAMVRSFAYEQAEGLLSAAIDAHEPSRLGAPAGELVLEWAQAALRCGRMTEARRRFDQAAAILRLEGAPDLLAEAALGLGGHWVNEHRAPAERARVLGLQREALAGLAEGEVALRCRLRARLAAEAVFDGGPIEPVFEALDATRRCGDPLALAEVLSLAHHALFTPLYTRTRIALADELIKVASEVGDGILTLMGLCWRTVDLFHLGDDRAERALEELRERANALANKNIQWVVGVIDTMLLIRAGRLADAEAAALQCYERGEAVGEVDTLGYLTAQLVGIRWLQDRDTEILDRAKEVAASPTLILAEFSLRVSAAVVLARSGHHTAARAALDHLGPGANDLGALPQSSTWPIGMVGLVELAAELGDAALARKAYDQLLPFADLPVVASLAVLCAGSTERSLGLAALTFGEPDQAIAHLELAVEDNRRLGNRPMTAMAQATLARALRARDGSGDLARARQTLQLAIDEADANEMASRAVRWSEELAGWDVPPSADDLPAAVERRGAIRCEQGRWAVALDGLRVHVPDRVGMHYLATLLTRPGQPISALTLASDGMLRDDASRQDLLDDTAQEHYEARARYLLDALKAAENRSDHRQVDRLRAEIDALTDQIEAARGLGGRPRAFADPAERARTSVRKAIKRAIDTVDEVAPTIAEVLRAHIETGYVCTYMPDPRAPVVWST